RAAAVATVVLTVVVALALAAVTQARRADRNARLEVRQRHVAEEQRHLAQERQRVLRRHLYGAQLNLAQQAAEAGDLARARELLDSQRPQPGEEDLRGFEWRYLWQFCEGDTPRLTLRGHTSWLDSVKYSPDGKMLATCGTDATVKLWSAATGREIATLAG